MKAFKLFTTMAALSIINCALSIAQAQATQPATAQPSASNTGPTNAKVLVETGTMTITTPNTHLSNIAVKGCIYNEAEGTTITNFTVDGNGGAFGIKMLSGSIDVEHGSITNCSAAGIFGFDWTAGYCDIGNMGSDATDASSGCWLHNCFIHDIGASPGAHADGIQMVNGKGTRITGNYFDLPWQQRTKAGVLEKANSCIFLNGSHGGAADLSGTIITGNWFNGGNYSIYCLQQEATVITGNHFGADYQFGFLDNPASLAKPTWTGNVDMSGKPVGK